VSSCGSNGKSRIGAISVRSRCDLGEISVRSRRDLRIEREEQERLADHRLHRIIHLRLTVLLPCKLLVHLGPQGSRVERLLAPPMMILHFLDVSGWWASGSVDVGHEHASLPYASTSIPLHGDLLRASGIVHVHVQHADRLALVRLTRSDREHRVEGAQAACLIGKRVVPSRPHQGETGGAAGTSRSYPQRTRR